MFKFPIYEINLILTIYAVKNASKNTFKGTSVFIFIKRK